MDGPLHIAIGLFFTFLLIAVIANVILSWLPISPGNPVSRFVSAVVYPIREPLDRRIPPLGMINITPFIAIWAIWFVRGLILFAIPQSW